MKRFLFAMGMCLLVFIGHAQEVELSRIKISKNISLKVPTLFLPMTESERRSRYVSYRQPIAIFTHPRQEADLGINQNSTPWIGDDLTILRDFQKANIQNLFTEVSFTKDEIKTIGGREFVIFEFLSKVSGEENTYGGISGAVSKYTIISYTLYEDYVLLFNFTCDANIRVQWQEAAREVIESVRIN